MARGIRGWQFKDVVGFLKAHNFYQSHTKGSHYFFVKISKEKEYVVEVNFLTGGKTYPPLTMKTMIANSGIPEKEWRTWTSS